MHESISEESNELIHTERDTLALSNGNAAHSLYFARYAAAFMAEVAKGSLPAAVGTGGEGGTGGTAMGGAGAAGVAAGGAGALGGAGSAGSGGVARGGNGGAAGVPASVGAGLGGSGGTPRETFAGSSAATPQAQPAAGSDEALACSCRLPAPRRHAPSAGFCLLAGVAGLGFWRRGPRTRRAA